MVAIDRHKWLCSYAKTAEETSNRRVRITATVLQAKVLLAGLLSIFVSLAIHFQLNKCFTLFIIIAFGISMCFLSLFFGFNARLSKQINRAKFNLLIKEEEKIWNYSLYKEEYKDIQNKKHLRLSWIDMGMSVILGVVDLIITVASSIILFV